MALEGKTTEEEMSTSRLPVGTVTFLFTDIEASTELLAASGDDYGALLEMHQVLLTKAIHEHGGEVVDTQGDSFFAAFSTPTAGIEAAVQAQRSLHGHKWPEGMALRVRMGVHTGEVRVIGDKYVGMEVHRAARIGDAGHGGQILVSDATRLLIGDSMPEGVHLIDLGEYRLKGLPRPERIHQVSGSDLEREFPPLRTLEGARDNIQRPANPFIGREREKSEVARILQSPDVRLLTLSGAGGTGKTRLALETAFELQDRFEDGVVFVRLASISSFETVPTAILQGIKGREVAGRSHLETLIDLMKTRHMLLVLDNFEHVMDAAPMLTEIMAACEHLKILVTSREVLRVTAEWEFSVPPLSIPVSTDDVEKVFRSEAVQLFVDRARAVNRSFQLNPDNVKSVASICRLLDGLPLALELAAARIRILSPRDIATRLESDLDILTGGPRDLPERQRALRSTIDWSYQLLDESEKKLFRRLGVFAGGWTLEAMESVCATEDDFDIFEGLASLVDKSLVSRRGEEGAEARFGMLRSIRDFAIQCLQEGDDHDRTREAHARYFLDLAKEGSNLSFTAEQRRWSDLFNAEIDNLRLAMDWFLANGRPDLAAQLGWALWTFWWIQSRFEEGAAWMQATLADERLDSADERGKANVVLGILSFGSSRYDVATKAFQDALELCEASGNSFGSGLSLSFIGFITGLGDPVEGHKLVEQGLQRFREGGHEWGEAFGLFALTRILVLQERYVEAVDSLNTALTKIRSTGERVILALCLINMGWTRLALFDAAAADEAFEEALQLLTEIKDTVGMARVLEGLSGAALVAGDPERAAVLFGAAEGARRSVGAGLWVPDMPTHQRTEAAIREAIGDERYESLWAEGTTLSPEEVQPLATAAATHAG
jgi:predicted ATPase/class 3 adenylate cyclase